MIAPAAHRHGTRRRPERPADGRSASRKRWVGLLAMARGGELAASAHRRIDFLHEARRAAPTFWQPDGYSAVKLGEAFLALGEGACECADPARREGLLALLGGCAAALDVIVTARATEFAQRTWNRGDD